MTTTADVVIAGSGIIGLCCATSIAASGKSVLLIGEHRAGEASGAAAGMLAPSVEKAEGPAHDFAVAARDMYPDYLEELADAVGIRVPLNRLGVLQVALTERGVRGLRKSASADSEWIATVLGRPVIKAFNNILADSLAKRGNLAGAGERIALPVAGDDVKAKELVQQVFRHLGFDAIDGGTLAESWRQQPGTPAYCKDLNATQLQVALDSADKREIANYRKAADEAAAPYLTPFKTW